MPKQGMHAAFPYLDVNKISLSQPCLDFAVYNIIHMLPCRLGAVLFIVVKYTLSYIPTCPLAVEISVFSLLSEGHGMRLREGEGRKILSFPTKQVFMNPVLSTTHAVYL